MIIDQIKTTLRERLPRLIRLRGPLRRTPRYRKLQAALSEATKRADRAERRLENTKNNRKKERRRERKSSKAKVRRAVKEAQLSIRHERTLAVRIVQQVGLENEEWSLTPGVDAWRRKWEESPGKRILMFAPSDFAGSFYKWTDAINKHSEYAARMVSLNRHRYGYPLDIHLPFGATLPTLFPEFYSQLIDIADSADVIHIKDQTGFVKGKHGLEAELLTQFGKPMVFTHYGGHARSDQHETWYRDHVRSFDARVAMTPDLCYEWADWEFIPHSIDADSYPFVWADSNRLSHSPSTKSRKGTAEFLQAFDSIELDLDLEVIHNVSFEEAIARKQRSALFFDQAGRERDELGGEEIGWYGNSALEAAVAGIPVMAHMSQQAFRRAANSGSPVEDACPFINVDPSIDSLKAAIEEFFNLTSEQRADLSIRTRRYVEDFHSQQAVARQLSALYDRLLVSSRVMPSTR